MLTSILLVVLFIIMSVCAVAAYLVWFGAPAALFVLIAYLVIKFIRMYKKEKE